MKKLLVKGGGFMVEHLEVERAVEEFKSREDILGYFSDETRATI